VDKQGQYLLMGRPHPGRPIQWLETRIKEVLFKLPLLKYWGLLMTKKKIGTFPYGRAIWKSTMNHAMTFLILTILT